MTTSGGSSRRGPSTAGGCFLIGGAVVFGLLTVGAIASIVRVSDADDPGAVSGNVAAAATVGFFFLVFLVGCIAAFRTRGHAETDQPPEPHTHQDGRGTENDGNP